MDWIQTLIDDHREKVLLVIYFGVVFIIAGELFQTLGDGWRHSEVFRPLVLSLEPTLSITIEEFAVVCFGFFVGLLTLFTIDPKKRWQGMLLWIGTGSALLGLSTTGLFIPNIDFGANLPWLIGGLVVGLISGGGRAVFRPRATEALEFRRSGSMLYYVISLIVVLGLVEYHVHFPELISVTSDNVDLALDRLSANELDVTTSGIAFNTVLAGVFIITLQRFVKYDSEQSFFVLGPVGSGKSLFLVGMYLAAIDEAEERESDTPLRPSSDLFSLAEEFDSATQQEGWALDATLGGDVEKLEFQYLKGRFFPKNLHLSSRDYAGEHLEELPNALTSSPGNIDDTVVRMLADQVKQADTLIFIIDVERLDSNEPLGIEAYFDILDVASGKDAVLVATKSDLLADEFREERNLEAFQHFDEFQSYANETLTDRSRSVRNLIQDTSGSSIHPVYYQTTVDEDGTRVPMRDANGNVQIVGFRELLKKIG